MGLSPDELKKRITAATALHGWRLGDLPDKLEKFGAQRHLATGLMDGRLEPRPALLTILANFFAVPEAWFTEEDWQPLIREEYQLPEEAKLGLRRQQQQLDMLREVVTRVARIESLMVAEDRVTKIEEVAQAALLVAENLDAKLDALLAQSSQPRLRREGGGLGDG